MNFGDALHILRNGGKVERKGWNGKNMFLFLVQDWDFQYPLGNSMDIEVVPFIMMKTADNKLVPWLASQTDVLAHDWEKVAE